MKDQKSIKRHLLQLGIKLQLPGQKSDIPTTKVNLI